MFGAGIDALWGAPSAKTAGLTLDAVASRWAEHVETASGAVVGELTALRVSTVQACVALIANDVATIPLRVMRAQGPRPVEAADSRFYDLLMRRPNPIHTAFEFRQMMTAQALLRGNAYAYKARDRAGRVTHLWPLTTAECAPQREGRRIVYDVTAYDGEIAGRFTGAEIMHLRGFTWDGLAGLDRLFVARDTIGLAASAERTQSGAYRNGTRMPGYWSTEQNLTDEQLAALAEQLRAATTGGNAYRSPVLDAGLAFKTTGQTFADAQTIETRKHQIVEVCAAFNVVPAVLGIDDKTQAFASVEAMMRWHLQHTLRPWLTAWEQALDRDVLDGAAGPLFARFDTRDMEKASTRERAEAYRALIELGVYTRNEARGFEGLAPLDGLDAPLTPMNMTGGGDATGAS